MVSYQHLWLTVVPLHSFFNWHSRQGIYPPSACLIQVKCSQRILEGFHVVVCKRLATTATIIIIDDSPLKELYSCCIVFSVKANFWLPKELYRCCIPFSIKSCQGWHLRTNISIGRANKACRSLCSLTSLAKSHWGHTWSIGRGGCGLWKFQGLISHGVCRSTTATLICSVR